VIDTEERLNLLGKKEPQATRTIQLPENRIDSTSFLTLLAVSSFGKQQW
jgi:hypothetical protein